jgi:hypothetical protein
VKIKIYLLILSLIYLSKALAENKDYRLIIQIQDYLKHSQLTGVAIEVRERQVCNKYMTRDGHNECSPAVPLSFKKMSNAIGEARFFLPHPDFQVQVETPENYVNPVLAARKGLVLSEVKKVDASTQIQTHFLVPVDILKVKNRESAIAVANELIESLNCNDEMKFTHLNTQDNHGNWQFNYMKGDNTKGFSLVVDSFEAKAMSTFCNLDCCRHKKALHETTDLRSNKVNRRVGRSNSQNRNQLKGKELQRILKDFYNNSLPPDKRARALRLLLGHDFKAFKDSEKVLKVALKSAALELRSEAIKQISRQQITSFLPLLIEIAKDDSTMAKAPLLEDYLINGISQFFNPEALRLLIQTAEKKVIRRILLRENLNKNISEHPREVINSLFELSSEKSDAKVAQISRAILKKIVSVESGNVGLSASFSQAQIDKINIEEVEKSIKVEIDNSRNLYLPFQRGGFLAYLPGLEEKEKAKADKTLDLARNCTTTSDAPLQIELNQRTANDNQWFIHLSPRKNPLIIPRVLVLALAIDEEGKEYWASTTLQPTLGICHPCDPVKGGSPNQCKNLCEEGRFKKQSVELEWHSYLSRPKPSVKHRIHIFTDPDFGQLRVEGIIF